VGGDFHWIGLPSGPYIAWPLTASWYLLGRHALVVLLRFLSQSPRRLWVPSYFCFDVAEYWKTFAEVVTYSDDPCRPEPDWSTLRPGKDDLVVAVNYFGVRSGDPWRDWRRRNPCVLVEDHSHDPVSGWALRSNAEYAFASLRKTLPVPDGGILWSPRGLPLPASGTGESEASTLKLSAMLWKRDYLRGHASPDAKPIYRDWQRRGEVAFDRSQVSFVTELSRQYLSSGVPSAWRIRRGQNVRRLLSRLGKSKPLLPLFAKWPLDAAPLGAVFAAPSQEQRDDLRQQLQECGVYCPVLWPPAKDCDPAARRLAERLLTIPTDQRYGARDMEKVASIVNRLRLGAGPESGELNCGHARI
jgi:hypothetical protein